MFAKNNLTAAVVAISFLLVACSQSMAAIAPPRGAVGYWSFDEKDIQGTKIIDASGNHHDGKIVKASLVAGRQGAGLKLAGDGKAGGVTIKGLGIKSKQASIAMWIKKDQAGVRRLIFINGLFQVGFAGTELFVHTGRVGRADTNMPLSTVNLPANQWTHMAITWDTAASVNNVKIYFNGHLTLQATLDAARDKALKIDTLYIGHMGPGQSSDQNFGGLIDELAVYDKVLAAGKIRSYCARVLSAAGAGAPQPVTQRIISQGTRNMGPIYVTKTTFKGRKKMLRVASELISRMLGANSIAEANLPQRVKQWQQTGLDGCVFNIASSERGNLDRYHLMNGQWWALIPRTYEELQPDIKAFQAVKDWGRLTDNFLWSSYAVWQDGPRIKVQDWFNDDHWKIILANVSLQARVAKECGFKGVMFDVEQYEGHHALGGWHIPFSYPNYSEDGYKQNGESKPRPFNEVAAKIKQRGKQYAQTLCAAYPGLKIILIPGLYEWATRLGDGPLENNHCGLYPSFLDGMLTGLDKKATIIGGSELTYDKTRLRDMANIRKEFDQAIDKLCGESKDLQTRLSFAAGVWVDAERKWSDTDESINARNIEEHQEAVKAAFTVSDEYAWLYGEQSKYLGDKPTPLMKRYFKAGVDAHPQK